MFDLWQGNQVKEHNSGYVGHGQGGSRPAPLSKGPSGTKETFIAGHKSTPGGCSSAGVVPIATASILPGWCDDNVCTAWLAGQAGLRDPQK